MNRLELFEIWAPPAAPWSPWAKPALFAEMPLPTTRAPEESGHPTDVPLQPPEENYPGIVLPSQAQAAVVVDLPGVESVRAGLALAKAGYRPVPLFNVAYHPAGVINLAGLTAWMVKGAEDLAGMAIPQDAPPAFLLDALRQKVDRSPSPGQFDNRWVVFPQDFPSATSLRQHGISRACVFQSSATVQPQSDLVHVLLRWQEAGIELSVYTPGSGRSPEPLRVSRPSGFKSLWYRVLTIAGLRRNSAGGFGSIVPHPSSG